MVTDSVASRILDQEARALLTRLARVNERDPRRRTWIYKLRSPTFPELRAVLTHSGVEDTSLDSNQLEMLRD